MLENEFEKKLQQKMDKLQVQPAEELWAKIQVQVAAKKRKTRGVVFFFLLSGLFIAALLFINSHSLFNKKQTNADITTTTSEKKNETELIAEKSSVNDISAGNQKPAQQAIAGIRHDDDNNTISSTVSSSDKKSAGTHLIKRKTKGSTKTNVTAPAADEVADDAVHISATTSNNKITTGNIDVNTGEEIFTETKKIDTVESKNAQLIKVPGEKQQEKNNNNVVKENKKKEKNSQHKWGLSFSFSGGISSTGNSYLKNALYSNEISANPGTDTTAGNPGGYTASKTTPGFSYTAGIQLYRDISSRSKIITGLQYQFISTSIKTGQEVALSASADTRNVFAYGTSKVYHNNYHFILLPVSISTRVFSFGKRDIYFDVGVQLSRLISTNALSFNPPQGIYYKDENGFNKTQIGLAAAIKLNLAGKNNAAFYIGPEFYYGITPLASSGMYADAHTKFIGIRLQKNLKK